MVTNNFRKILIGTIFSAITTGTTNPQYTSPVNVVQYDGTEEDVTRGNYEGNRHADINMWSNMQTGTFNNTQDVAYMMMRVGTSDLTPTPNDYNLNSISTDMECTSASCSTTPSLTKQYTATFTNASNSDITIKELGLYAMVGNAFGFGIKCLIEHTVLDTPITVSAGNTQAFTIELSM